MADSSEENKENSNDPDILDEISESASKWYSYFNDNIDTYEDDRKFLFLSQWSGTEKAQFDQLEKPMLTFNKLYDFFKKIVGEQRQNTPDLEVRCLNGESTQEAVTLRSDLVRQISYDSKAHIAYQTAFEHMLSGGFGGLRVVTKYRNSKSFDQEIVVKRVVNPERMFFDTSAQEVTKRDGMFCGYYDQLSHQEFKDQYPGVEVPESFPSDYEVKNFSWGTKDLISVVEYYKKEWHSFLLYKLSDGSVITQKEYSELIKEYEDSMLISEMGGELDMFGPPEIIDTRESGEYKIMCYKVIYGEILERYEWASTELPLVYIPGDTHIVDGEERTISFIRFARDAQKFLNYCASEIAQAITNSRREQFIGTKANVAGNEEVWINPSKQQGILLAETDPISGQLPIKLNPSEISQSLMMQFQNADNEIQSILGFYEANRGAQGRELSGVAVKERQRTGNMGVAVFFDNLDVGIEQVGKIIMSLIPTIYDTERRMSLQTSTGMDRDIVVNQEFAGGQKENDLTEGEYDVVISAGQNFAVQRQEAVGLLVDMVRVNPQVFPLVADLVAENLDIENNPQLVERFKSLVPPEILAKEAGEPPPPQQPDPMQEIAQQEMQLRQQQLQLEQKKVDIQEAELELKYQSGLAENEREQRQQYIDQLKAQNEAERTRLEHNIALIRGEAEVEKAHMDYQGDLASAWSRIIAAEAAVAKSNHATACEIGKIPSVQKFGERFNAP